MGPRNETIKIGLEVNERDSVQNLAGGNYKLLVENHDLTFDFFNIEITDPLAVKASFTCVDSTVLNSGTADISFDNSSLNGQIYNWDFGDGSYSTEFSPTHSYSNPGIYSVALIIRNNSCEDHFSKTIKIRPEAMVLSLNEETEITKLKKLNANITVYSLMGQVVYKGKQKPTSEFNFPPGLYLVAYEYDTQIVVEKAVLQ